MAGLFKMYEITPLIFVCAFALGLATVFCVGWEKSGIKLIVYVRITLYIFLGISSELILQLMSRFLNIGGGDRDN